MTSLLQRLRRRGPSRRERPKSADTSNGTGRFWLTLLVAVVVLLGFFFWLTSARILGEPVEIAHGVETPVFAHSLGSLLGANFSGGNRVETLVNGDEFFPAMLAAIRAARHSVTLETYIWSSGAISDQFIAALEERAKAGVKVHVLVDGMGSLKLSREDRGKMMDAGVEFSVYGREHWYEIKPNINHRTHRKLLIIDGKVGFTGGMCIDDKWLGNAESKDVWRETQVKVEGPAVLQMQATFATNWLQTTSRLLFGVEYFPEVTRMGDVLAECYKSGPGEDPENARISYLVAIAAARKSIVIAHAYFVPDDLAIEMLLQARQRGVEIEVIVPAINDSKFGRAASRSRWGKLLASGVKFHRYTPAMYHPKVMVVDDYFVTIGSVNFDNRSFGINDEVNVNILSREVARRHLEIIRKDIEHSTPLTLEEFRDRGFLTKTIDHFCGLFRSQL